MRYHLKPQYRRFFRFCYKMTFWSFGLYFVYCMFIVSLVIAGQLPENNWQLSVGGFLCSATILFGAISMAVYAVGYVALLWKNGTRREALLASFLLLFLNFLAGYLWFYYEEVKDQEIKLAIPGLFD